MPEYNDIIPYIYIYSKNICIKQFIVRKIGSQLKKEVFITTLNN